MAVDAVGDCRHDPVVNICEVAVDATPVVSVIGDKRKLPAEPSGKPSPVVQFFNRRSSMAKKVQLDCLEMQLKTAEIRMKELEKYIEEGKEDLKVVSNASFAGEQGFSAEECVGLIQGLITSSKEEKKKVRNMLSSIKTNIKGWNKMPSRDEAVKQEEEAERREDEKKERHRLRNRHEGMTAAQIADHQARNQHANMSPAQIAADLERHRHASMTPEQIADHQVRNQRASMSPANRGRAQARDGRRNESYLPVEQQWDLANPCVK